VNGKEFQTEYDKNGQQVKVPKKRPCGKNPKVFFRVDYEEIHHHHRREGKSQDVFGFCPEHAEILAEGPARWSRPNPSYRREIVNGLRGIVKSITALDPSEVPDPVALSKREDTLRLMAAVKGDIKRRMCQRSTEKLSLDDWRDLFEECINEHCVEQVMLS
jgi:hypothetical protein